MVIKREVKVALKEPEEGFLLPEKFSKIKKISQDSFKKLMKGRERIIKTLNLIKQAEILGYVGENNTYNIMFTLLSGEEINALFHKSEFLIIE